jgi:hypothetical protein
MVTEMTNLLLGVLIAIVSFVAKFVADKINEILKVLNNLSITHQKHSGEISELKDKVDDHETRIRIQEHLKQ